MKKILFVAFLAFGCASMTMAFSHKHHKAPQQEMVSKQAKTVQDEGVEACSDTTDVAEDESDSLLAVAKMQDSHLTFSRVIIWEGHCLPSFFSA